MARMISKKSTKVEKKAAAKRVAKRPTLLAGGNPQIAKTEGDVSLQGESTSKETRYLDIYENNQLDERLVARWRWDIL